MLVIRSGVKPSWNVKDREMVAVHKLTMKKLKSFFVGMKRMASMVV